MVESAGKRALRTMDLIPFILENPGCSIKSLAEKFSVSDGQIEKDLQLIFMCGLPGYTPYELIDIVFDNGIVTVIEPQVLDRPRRFSKNELIVIILGLRILSELHSASKTNTEKIEKLITKISALVPTYNSKVSTNINSEFMSDLNRAINHSLKLEIEYTSVSKDETTRRNLLPIELYMLNGSLYLRAIDLDISAERVFRTDLIRINKVGEITNIQINSEQSEKLQISLEVSKSRRIFMERNSSIIQTVKETKNGFKVDVSVSNLQWLKRCILSNSPGIKVIAPAELALEIKQNANAILALYRS
jgi:proteasome accessory factor C